MRVSKKSIDKAKLKAVLEEVEEKSLTKQQRLASLLTVKGITKQKAVELAGYSPMSNSDRILKQKSVKKAITDVESVRQEMQEEKGYRFRDSVEFTKGLRDDTENDPADRLRANAQMNGLLGYDAPKQVQINERREILIGIGAVVKMAKEFGLSPAELKLALDQEEPLAREEELSNVLDGA
jgi:phage terminase small subunit